MQPDQVSDAAIYELCTKSISIFQSKVLWVKPVSPTKMKNDLYDQLKLIESALLDLP